MSILLLLRLPIISVLLVELHDFKVIIDTAKRMASPFLSILFSFYLFISTYSMVAQGLYTGLVTLKEITEIENSSGNALYY